MDNTSKDLLLAILSSQALFVFIQGLWKFVSGIKHKYSEGISQTFAEAKIELNAKTEALRYALNAQRSSVCVFHNGEHYFTGESVKKMSMVAEALDDNENTVSTKEETQNVPIGIYLRNLLPLFNQDYQYEKDTHVHGDILSTLHKSLGIRSCLILPIFKERPWYWVGEYDKKIIAFVYIGWSDEKEITSSEIGLAKSYVDTINYSLIDLATNK